MFGGVRRKYGTISPHGSRELSMSAADNNAKLDLSALDRVPDRAWSDLASKRLYFGHHSVGCNLIDGLTDIMALRPQVKFPILEATNPTAIGAPGLTHSGVGANRDPDCKIR